MSEHFTIAELSLSQTATRAGIDNTPPLVALENLERLCAVLEKVRSLVGKPVLISSGYRCPVLNRMVGGAEDSAHVQGLAADINVNGITPKALAMLIRESGIEYDQLINETNWVHIGLRDGVQRRQELTAHFTPGRPTTYTKGIA